MPFFEEVDTLGIVERHIKQVSSLEETKARTLLKTYKEVRQELRDRLDTVRAGSFTAQQLRGVLAQVESAIIAITRSLKEDMSSAALDAATMGVDHLVSEIEKFSSEFEGAIVPINLNVQLIAQDTKNFLLNQYDSSIDAYGKAVISDLTTSLTQSSLAELSYSQVVQNLGQYLIGEQWKLERIARTELHNVYNLGKMNGMLETRDTTLPDLKKTLIHPMDSRTGEDSKKAAREHLIVPIDKPFKYTWKGKDRIFMAPPDRPNDRSILVPFRDVWNE